jgi:hypothetical protein
VELLPHPDSAINPAASNGAVKIDSVDVFMAFSLLLLRGHNFQFVGAGSKEWISVVLALLSDVMCFLSCITTRKMSYGTSPHVSSDCGVHEHLRATMDEGKSFILIADRKQLWRMRAPTLTR